LNILRQHADFLIPWEKTLIMQQNFKVRS
jgi:hypothetical protein